MQTLNVLDSRFSALNPYNILSTDPLTEGNTGQSIFDSRKTLTVMRQLQTTLDLDMLLNIFSIEVNRYINFSSLNFKSNTVNNTLSGSREAKKERSFMLKADDELVGTLTYGVNQPISLINFKVLHQLHSCLVHPLKNAIAYHDAMKLAMHDGLTGLGNRRYFDEQIKRSMHNAKRQHNLVGLVLGDLNRFKAINDTFGHGVGDLVLKEFAHVLRKCTRDSDSVFRFGGDEFAIIVENADENALAIIESRINIEILTSELLSKYQLGCSIGSTFMIKTDNESSLFERADKILYTKKRSLGAKLSVV